MQIFYNRQPKNKKYLTKRYEMIRNNIGQFGAVGGYRTPHLFLGLGLQIAKRNCFLNLLIDFLSEFLT